ncbi:MAG TPA: hypothetical protein VIV11_41675 [Kofleriaceae bacterium]
MHRLVVVIAIAGCGKPHDATPDAPVDVAIDAPMAPVFRNPVNLPDEQLATEALKILGANVSGASSNCEGCHGMTRQRLNYWRALSDVAIDKCFTDLSVATPESALAMIDCARSMPEVPGSDFDTKKLGIYATAAKLPWYAFTFWRAYGDEGTAKLAQFQDAAGMPKGDAAPALTQEQFDIVAEWFSRGVPALDATLPNDPPPQSCTPGISSEVAAHVTAMAQTGWRAVNRTNMMAMYDCGTATDPRNCLAERPLATTLPFGTGWDLPGRGSSRLLYDVTYVSSFWTRSSPDGRFVAHGVANVSGSYVIDLQRNAQVSIATQYDPAFFPDNSGFVFQGGTRNTCSISVLTSNPTSIAMTEPECVRLSTIGLYQHVGRMLGGGDYFGIDSQFVSDDGGKTPTIGDPDASFTSTGYTDFTPAIFDGTKFVAKARVRVLQPFEGDSVLSPSSKLELTRVSGPNERQIGYVLRKVNATPSGTTYSITTPEIARYCLSGGKPGFSYDERWIAFHHYVTNSDATELGFASSNDPGFTEYKMKGAANVYLMDLRTGVPIRITNMQPGQYALFPHFRSDGWIYFQVRDANAGHEYTIASDAALLAE